MARLADRLQRALIRLARQYAPQLVPAEPGATLAALGELAAALAGHNLLVMIGTPLADGADEAVARWVQSYVNLYDLLTRRLFPSFTQIKAFYADAEQPPIVVVQGTATPVLVVLARCVAPYMAARQDAQPSDLELYGLTDMMLDALEAGDLPRDEYRRLREDAAAQLRRILAAPVRQRALAAPQRALAEAFALALPAGFEPEDDLPPPESLPEAPVASTTQPFGPAIPVFFDKNKRAKRRPPVPGLPDKRQE